MIGSVDSVNLPGQAEILTKVSTKTTKERATERCTGRTVVVIKESGSVESSMGTEG
jgi:hypothetical protein